MIAAARRTMNRDKEPQVLLLNTSGIAVRRVERAHLIWVRAVHCHHEWSSDGDPLCAASELVPTFPWMVRQRQCQRLRGRWTDGTKPKIHVKHHRPTRRVGILRASRATTVDPGDRGMVST